MKRRLMAVSGGAALATSLVLGACADNDALLDEHASDSATFSLGAFNVLTRNYDNQRSGANLVETTLTQANVNATQFGKLLQLPVDDQIYAQVLYASGVTVAGASRNVIYVATVNNSVYAFDADSGGAPLWQKNYNAAGNPPNHTQVGVGAPYCNGGYNDFSGNVGIVGTPVIDGATGRMYFVTRHLVGTTYSQLLHAVDIATGNDAVGAQPISASVPGTGDDSAGGNLAFNPKMHNQRAALSLAGSTVYIAWSGHCDTPPYHGWVMTYNASNLAQIAAFSTTPNGRQGGIWQSGGGPLINASGVYFTTGNGQANLTGTITQGFAESVLKFGLGNVTVGTSFTAGNWANLNGGDADLGSGGPVAVPGTNLIFAGGKQGKGYLLDATNLGGLDATDAQIPQSFQAVDPTARPTASHHLHSSAVMWNGPQGLNTYVWGENDFLRTYRFNASTQKYNTPAAAVGSVLPPLGMPGGFMSLSANGGAAGTGILWATTPTSGDANHATVDGMLRAFNAETLALLWDSSAANNTMGTLPKYNPPIVAKGSVYVASFNNANPSLSNMVSVYRNLSTTQAPLGGTAWSLPGTIEAEKYDTGGANVAYFDSDAGNSGAAFGPSFRTDDVDIQPATDAGGGFDVGWIVAGEWLEYTVNVNTPGAYNIGLRVASASAAVNQAHIEVDGVNASGTVTIPNTGDWQAWTTVPATATLSTTGTHVIRVKLDAGGMNFNWMSFAAPVAGQAPFKGTPWPVPGTVQAEDYDTGGQGVAYSDTSAGNSGGSYRTDDVDIQATGDTGGGFNLGWTRAGEWLEYTVNIASTGTRTLSLRLATSGTGKTLHVELDGANISGGTLALPYTGGFGTYQTVSVATPSLSAGQHVLRVTFDTGSSNLNWFSL